MKKLKIIALFALIIGVFAFSANAQKSVKMKPSIYAHVFTGTVADSVTVNDTAYTFDCFANKATSLFYNVSVKIAEITSPGKCSVSLQGRIFSDDDFTNIATYNYSGTGTDTTLVFTQNTTKQFYRYYRVRVVYTDKSVYVYNIKFYFKSV